MQPGERHRIDRWRERRERYRANPRLNHLYRLAVGGVGALVLVVGVVLIPYPGPGWAIVIAGLAILASEFTWAARALAFVKGYYDAWSGWLKRQPRLVQGLFVLLTTAIVFATLWLLGTLSVVGGWVGLEQGWLRSPIFG